MERKRNFESCLLRGIIFLAIGMAAWGTYLIGETPNSSTTENTPVEENNPDINVKVLQQMRYTLSPTEMSDDVIDGIAINGTGFKVVRQPSDNKAFVSNEMNTVTLFDTAVAHGTWGLLSHSNKQILDLKTGDIIGVLQDSRIIGEISIERDFVYQALDPESTLSKFRGVEGLLTAEELFIKMYGSNQDGRIVLQTCIEWDNKPNWGRVFKITEPLPDS